MVVDRTHSLLNSGEESHGIPEAENRDLGSLLVSHIEFLEGFIKKHGRLILLHESIEDLVQGASLHVLRSSNRFEYRGELAFLGWLARLARQHLANRARYWKVRRRHAGALLREVPAWNGELSSDSGLQPADSRTGPSTRASRKEIMALGARALAMLLDRDQAILEMVVAGQGIGEIAAGLGISYDAAERARSRALARFQRTLLLLSPGTFNSSDG
jgi:RNA polymerase sigma factor (sigma-70 family)